MKVILKKIFMIFAILGFPIYHLWTKDDWMYEKGYSSKREKVHELYARFGLFALFMPTSLMATLSCCKDDIALKNKILSDSCLYFSYLILFFSFMIICISSGFNIPIFIIYILLALFLLPKLFRFIYKD